MKSVKSKTLKPKAKQTKTSRQPPRTVKVTETYPAAMLMIDFWIVRKEQDSWKLAPEVRSAISEHPDNGKCLFCGDGHKIVAVIAFCWREPDAPIYTAGICRGCEAKQSDEKLAEMTQQEVFPDRVAHVLSLVETCDQMEAEGLLETVGIDPITGSKRRQLTAKGRELARH